MKQTLHKLLCTMKNVIIRENDIRYLIFTSTIYLCFGVSCSLLKGTGWMGVLSTIVGCFGMVGVYTAACLALHYGKFGVVFPKIR